MSICNLPKTYFISDCHLGEQHADLDKWFDQFIYFCHHNPPQTLYIMGDLFDYYLGFDLLGQWGEALAAKLAGLSAIGISLYFLPGNRDFLVDKKFLALAKLEYLPDPSVIRLAEQLTISHGDRFCVHDKWHQTFRRISQSRVVRKAFLMLPKSIRVEIAQKIRQQGRSRALTEYEIEPGDHEIVKTLQENGTNMLIHGHTHRPMIRCFINSNRQYKHLVLPDWRNCAEYVVYCHETKQIMFKKIS